MADRPPVLERKFDTTPPDDAATQRFRGIGRGGLRLLDTEAMTSLFTATPGELRVAINEAEEHNDAIMVAYLAGVAGAGYVEAHIRSAGQPDLAAVDGAFVELSEDAILTVNHLQNR